jgi:hypothetical protein
MYQTKAVKVKAKRFDPKDASESLSGSPPHSRSPVSSTIPTLQHAT